ncbi:signal recognition particle-docking protein FtsY [Amycolatopsis alba]|uniref:Signal recognition particle receptor FtsY n=1 Tax=Amycolatopsis alba DSM 44262 TaxID=1125972 RepID=A0A229RYC1_AMYAL|nr:signal recognition particle-docking protein FtsY [Amycolatopsis alba]OXM51688.1 signal recognition particle-docking protein FtsY [Amycolatopsis alba DSM 44262]
MSSTPWFWIVVVAVVVLVAVLVAGLLIARRRRISLDESKAAAAVEREKPKGGGYTAAGGIALAPGGEKTEEADEPEHPVEDRPETDGQPAVGDDASVPRDSAQRTVRDVELPEPAEEAAPAEEIAPASGRLERLRGRLGKSRSVFGQSLLGLLGAGDLDEDSWQDVEDTLLMADLGAATTTEIVERLREELKRRAVRTSEEARAVLQEVLTAALSTDAVRAVRALPHTVDGVKQPAVVLVAGVNGTGKTTTTGKLARVLVAQGSTVVLGAADTFRAAAADQLQTWAERVGAEVVRGKEGADPAAVAFDAVKRGTEAGVDAVLVDTAGRLHTKTGLMDELGKVKRVVEKQAKVDEVLLVLDATTGQNGLMQARVFSEVIDVTGIVLTKLDGTAKGGIVFQVQRELGVPVKLVGLGEGPDDLAPFEPGAFVEALLSN